MEEKDQDKQRAAAELLAGLLGGEITSKTSLFIPDPPVGSKHWPTNAQERLWEWYTPYIQKLFNQNIKTDTIPIWTSFLEVCIFITSTSTFV